MPSNTNIDDMLWLLNHLGDIHKARAAVFELSYFRTHGELPADAKYIERVHIIGGKELIEMKNAPSG